jgi:hypothetical protein
MVTFNGGRGDLGFILHLIIALIVAEVAILARAFITLATTVGAEAAFDGLESASDGLFILFTIRIRLALGVTLLGGFLLVLSQGYDVLFDLITILRASVYLLLACKVKTLRQYLERRRGV